MYEQFNWDTMKGCEERCEFYRNNWDKRVTEDEFVATVVSWPKPKIEGKKYRCRTPSKARRDYNCLKTKFGFFIGE
jgi:hypothetical protein